jgi:hypothetical protein
MIASTERRTLLVAGAAAGLSATFATPFAAVLLGVELLLFERKPRSAIPVALARFQFAVAHPAPRSKFSAVSAILAQPNCAAERGRLRKAGHCPGPQNFNVAD